MLGIRHFNIHCLSEKYTSVVLAIFYFTSGAEDGSIGLAISKSEYAPCVKCRDVSGPRPAVPARVWLSGHTLQLCPPDHTAARFEKGDDSHKIRSRYKGVRDVLQPDLSYIP